MIITQINNFILDTYFYFPFFKIDNGYGYKQNVLCIGSFVCFNCYFKTSFVALWGIMMGGGLSFLCQYFLQTLNFKRKL